MCDNYGWLYHQRRNEMWDTDIDTERRLCPLYTIIPHDFGGREQGYDLEGIFRGNINWGSHHLPGERMRRKGEHGTGVLSIRP